jgi:hypothetical protein
MDDRIAAMKELELKVERTLRMSEKEQLRVLLGLQEIIDEGPEKDMFWIRTQRNRIYYNTTKEVRDMFNKVEKKNKDEKLNNTKWERLE